VRLRSDSINNLRNEDWKVPLQEMGRMKWTPILGMNSPHNMNSKDLHWRSDNQGPVQVEAREVRGSFALPVPCIYH
jgi:hypothetical protein